MRKYNNYEFDKPLIEAKVSKNLQVIVVLPSFKEPNLINTLNSLRENRFSEGTVEVIIVINESDTCGKSITNFHQNQLLETITWAINNNTDKIKFFPIYIDKIDSDVAGAGMARKIGMDEAYKRFESNGNLQGIISNLDADSVVQENYLSELIKIAKNDHKTKAFSIYYEHLLTEHLSEKNRKSIVSYESHLRYYIRMQKLLKLPYAFQTVGSSMAVKAFAYAEAFGMNKRQAGEDFYFLQKFIKTGCFKDINTTAVYPSARISDRVPFGTGKSLNTLMNSNDSLSTYNYKSFQSLETLINNLENIYYVYKSNIVKLDKPIFDFLELRNFEKRYLEIKNNTKNFTAFKKRFFRWFDAFILMKYLHFARDNFFPNIPVEDALNFLFHKLNFNVNITIEQKLLKLREIDRNGE